MKTTLFLIFISFASVAQQVGVKAGANYLLSTGDLKTDYSIGKVGFVGGLFVKEDKGNVNILFEAFYSQVSTKNNFKVHSLNLPLMLESKGKVTVQGGFNTSMRLKTKIKEVEEYQASIKPFSIDAAAGLSFYPINYLGFNLRALYPLLDQTYKPIVFQLTMQYAIRK